MNVSRYQLIAHDDERGRLVAIEGERDIPFVVRRVYYMYGMSAGVRRGCHAHRSLEQLLVCMRGSCQVLVDDGKARDEVVLDDPCQALYIGPGTWREVHNFSPDAMLMVLASEHYDEKDVIYDYDEYLRYVAGYECDD